MATARTQLATAADLGALPDHVSAEIIHGVIVEKASPSAEHGMSQLSLGATLKHRFQRQPGGRWPGGWWFGTEIEVEYETHEVYLHDVVGWRRDRVPQLPAGRPVRTRPDWACELLSPSNAKRDLVDVTAKLDTFTLQPLAAVAKFKSLVARFKILYASGDLSEADQRRLGELISDAEAALRSIERPGQKAGPHVKLAGGVAVAAGAAWKLAGALAADDVTGIGVADDIAIPFVIVGAAALSAIALISSGPKPVVLDYGPARAKLELALRQMTELLGISTALAVQGPRAAGQLSNIAVHLARLLAVAAVGGHPSGDRRRKTVATTSTGGQRSRHRSRTSSRQPKARLPSKSCASFKSTSPKPRSPKSKRRLPAQKR